MDVSIIIVNWNSAAFLRQCLTSIYQNTDGIAFEVIVVDNASFDGSRELVETEFPRTIFIQSSNNIGFAKANNFGAAQAEGTRLLFLNPDTVVLGDAVSQMASIFLQRPDAGAVGCKLLNTDGSLQTSCIQPFPTIINQTLIADLTLVVAAKLGVWGVKPLFVDARGVWTTEAISGACLMVSRETFQAVGGFSPEYFMYTEDIDLCYKIRKAGLANYYSNTAAIVHHGGGSSHHREESSFSTIQMRESIFKFLRKTRGRLYANSYRTAMTVVALVRIIVISSLLMPTILLGRESDLPLRHSLIKWTSVLRWSLALEKWAH